VTGGEIYRGIVFPEMYGHYIYADYCSGNFWSLFDTGGGNWINTPLGDLGSSFTAFGVVAAGEIFVTNGSTVYWITEDTGITITPTNTETATSTATPTKTSTPTSTPGGRPTRTSTPAPPTITPGGNQVHISDLDGSSAPNGATRWNATVEITVLDQNGAPAAGATVSGNWSGGVISSGSCVTDVSGKCTITRALIRNTIQSVTFTVTNVSAAEFAYNPGANTDPDGDSDGTVIVVNKP
jgi:hypothetical protein